MNKFKMGIIADDITGANDIGVMFSKNNYVAKVYSLHDKLDLSAVEAEVMIIDTDSRFDDSETAAAKVKRATQLLKTYGCNQYFNKTCSVFRGNIGAEFDALLDVLEKDFAPVVLGFPKNGRTTKVGIHYVHGKLLEQSEFANDPINPMTTSYLPDILNEQSNASCSILSYRTVQQGVLAIQEQLDRDKINHKYVIIDVTSQDDLRVIAQSLLDEKVLCGSSAIAEEIANLWGMKDQLILDLAEEASNTVLTVAGSVTPQTREQIKTFIMSDNPTISVDTNSLLTEESREVEMKRVVEEASEYIRLKKNILIYVTNEPEQVKETQELGRKLGKSKQEVGRLISVTLSSIVTRLVDKTTLNKLVIAGGDTSASICSGLDIEGVQVLYEIEPGLPSCLVDKGKKKMLLVLKSGSFGKPDFLLKAINHLEALVPIEK